jgi:hypothetical protein
LELVFHCRHEHQTRANDHSDDDELAALCH